jgi:hypothetical protein
MIYQNASFIPTEIPVIHRTGNTIPQPVVEGKIGPESLDVIKL